MTTPAADPEQTVRVSSDSARYQHARSEPGAQFAPGTVVGGRYRIGSVLGAGGMGEVYRAEDTKLGQNVALKFLPARLARDPILLNRLHEEVRLGRQIAHPNVCRIYDIGDSDGAHFVAMEYVDGEDLSRLLRRIGRLAHDKAVDIARGIAAGLAAAHAKGILHRDLKPANVMVDAHGDARIMDFGLALGLGQDDGTISGTPAYMAPEQFDGTPATVQSDLYALGLVMYELFTGKRAFEARTMAERMRTLTSEITTPSSHIRDIDPAVERIILRCLSNDPLQRPRSAREVINALPGGDPLAAALAAGETPSPSIVAAAGTAGSLRPVVAWSLLAVLAICLATTLLYRATSSSATLTPVPKHPVVLSDLASGILRKLAIPEMPFVARTFERDRRYEGWIFTSDSSPARWERLRRGPAAVRFEYEEAESPRLNRHRDALQPGTSMVAIDMQGRLVDLTVRPRGDWKPRTPDWAPLFAAAGLDLAKFTPSTPEHLPSAAADRVASWRGVHPDDGTPIRVDAGSWRGIPTTFHIGGAWDAATGDEVPFSNPKVIALVTVLMTSVIVFGCVLAWRNVRARRGDRQSAFRAAVFVFVFEFVAMLIGVEHYADGRYEVELLADLTAYALLWGTVVAVLYLALEPFVRRRWPELLIGSTRLLAGNPRDPMVGRDVLIGIVAGLAHTALISAAMMFERVGEPPYGGEIALLVSPTRIIGHILRSASSGVVHGFLMVVMLVGAFMLLRRRIAAAALLLTVMLVIYYFLLGGMRLSSVAIALVMTTVIARYGLLAAAVAQASFLAIFHSPQFAGGSWFTLTGLISVTLVCAAALWAFRTSLGTQHRFASNVFDE